VQRAEETGIDLPEVQQELRELERRRSTGTVYLALFGEISSGKSTIINALLPQAQVATDPRGGTTRAITHYTWVSPAGDRLVLTDLTGLNEAEGRLETLAREEALRAHAVVFVCEGDLTRDELAALKPLLALGKPLIIALNKVDLYSADEIAAIQARLQQYLEGTESAEIVPVSAGGMEEVIRVHPDGREERVARPREPRVEALREAIQRRIDADAQALEQLRDASVFVLTTQKLDQTLAEHRRARADDLVKTYTRRAVIGALAAVAPGMDIAIQGYLGLRFLQELCALYEVSVRDIDLERFLKSVSSQTKAVPIAMAVAGNAFKAFPGMGTVAGGLLHAVAYGLIFDSLGRAVARTLEDRGTFAATPALRLLEEDLRGNLEARARRIAEMALEARRTQQPTH
jgi:GTP-binding protein EngB required for normal cell division